MIDSTPSEDSSVASGFSSHNKSFKESSIRLAFTAPRNQIDNKIDRLNRLDEEFNTLMSQMRKAEYELEKAKRVGDRLR